MEKGFFVEVLIKIESDAHTLYGLITYYGGLERDKNLGRTKAGITIMNDYAGC